MDAFRKLGLSEMSIRALQAKGYTEPTEIQKKAIPLFLSGEKDILGQSQTGTGKTASFALPIIELIRGGSGVKALILVPTRELALQVTKEFESLKGAKDLRALTVYGGASIMEQVRMLEKGIDIVVGTPGRVIDLIERRKLNVRNIDFCVLDEADEMLNMGFIEDIETILEKTPKGKRMFLFSATIPPQIKKIAERFMRDYVTLKVERQESVARLVDQYYFDLQSGDRFEALRRVIGITPDFHGIIFCKTKVEVDELSKKLIASGCQAGALHGDISQDARERILAQFKDKRIIALIATDVAARGIDVEDLTHVINYSLPQSPDSYIHRIGRTGRAGKKGIAITFIIPSERHKLKFVEKASGCKLQRRELPSVSEVQKASQTKIEENIESIVSQKRSGRFDQISARLLQKQDPRDVVSALLERLFGKEEKIYSEVKKAPQSGNDHHIKSRFVERRGDRERKTRKSGGKKPFFKSFGKKKKR